MGLLGAIGNAVKKPLGMASSVGAAAGSAPGVGSMTSKMGLNPLASRGLGPSVPPTPIQNTGQMGGMIGGMGMQPKPQMMPPAGAGMQAGPPQGMPPQGINPQLQAMIMARRQQMMQQPQGVGPSPSGWQGMMQRFSQPSQY